MSTVLCKACGVVTPFPTELAVRLFRCQGCGREQYVKDYQNDADRLRAAVAGAMQNRADYDAKKRSGVACTQCGASMPLPESTEVDAFACPFCGAHHMVSQFVAPQLLAAHRMRDGVRGIVAEAQAKQRRMNLVILAIVAILSVLILGGIVLSRAL